jgi:hypothetical protein
MLTYSEFEVCRTLLTAARQGADFDETVKRLNRIGITRKTWEPLYERCGLKVFISGGRRYVYPPDNIVPFAPRTVAKCDRREWMQLSYLA